MRICLFMLATTLMAAVHCQDDAVTDYSNWMSQLPATLRSRPISRLAIPGAHNSFTSNLDMDSEMADGRAYQWIDIFNQVSHFISPIVDIVAMFGGGSGNQRSNRQISSAINTIGSSAKSIAYSWSQTQDLDVDQQLALGIRYFDARVGYQSSTGRIRIVHGLYGRTLATEMLPIASFARSHPNEVIVIYIRNVVNFDTSAHQLLATNLKRIFNDTLLAYQTNTETRNLATISLDWLAKQSPRIGNVIIIYDQPSYELTRQRTVFWPSGSSIVSIWAGSTSTAIIQSQLNSAIVRYTTPVDDRFSFFLEYQGGVATADASAITASLFSGAGTLKDDVALSTRDGFIQWLSSKRRDAATPKGAINLCLSDFVNQQYVDAVVALNTDDSI